MGLSSSTIQLSNARAGGFAAFNREYQLWWQRLPAVVRSPIWPRSLAILSILGLLSAFHQVVSGATQQGELRRKAAAVQVEATWRCNAVRPMSARDSCLQQLNNTAARNDAMPFARSIASAAP